MSTIFINFQFFPSCIQRPAVGHVLQYYCLFQFFPSCILVVYLAELACETLPFNSFPVASGKSTLY
ncbi:MAG: hypothetical protein N3E41_08785 [Thermofilaceae archaeon]|nr:hypothetical protein [Thermofilaceae archaeon]